MPSSPTATKPRVVTATPRRSAVVGEGTRTHRPGAADRSTVPLEPTATATPSRKATPRRISSVGLGTARRPATDPSSTAPKSPTTTTRAPWAAICHRNGRGDAWSSVGRGRVGTGRQVVPSSLATTAAALPLIRRVEPAAAVPPHRLPVVPASRGVQARASAEVRSVPAVPATATSPGRAATARRPASGMPVAALQRRPSALVRIVPTSPTTTQRVPVQTAPRRSCSTGVGRTVHRAPVAEVASRPLDPAATSREPSEATLASVRPPPGAAAHALAGVAVAVPASVSNAAAASIATAVARVGVEVTGRMGDGPAAPRPPGRPPTTCRARRGSHRPCSPPGRT